MCDLNRMTAGDSLFGANQVITEMEQAQQMATSLDNLANASIQKNTTIESLVITNAALTKTVQDIQQTLAQMTTAIPIATPVITPIITPDSGHPRPSHWNNIKPAWDKVGYCWSYSHKVKVGHNSSTCTSHKAGHQAGATRNNTMGAALLMPATLNPPPDGSSQQKQN
jgi:hypothetical protein